MSNAIQTHTVRDIWQMAGMIAASRLFGVKTQEEAASLMLIAQAEGLHPAVAARDYHIIQGRPCLKADAMMARFQQGGGVVEWLEVSDDRVAANFSHPTKCPKPVMIEWTNATVKQAQIKSDMHTKYPRQMKRARVISEGVRTVLPECVCGVYAPEEIATKVAELEAVEAEASRALPPAEAVKPIVTIERTTGKAAAKEFADNLPTRTVPPPTDPEAAALDAKINGGPLDMEHEVPTALKPRKMVKLSDLDREHAERALKIADWQVTKTKEFSAQHNEGTKNIPILKKLLASMPSPAPAKDELLKPANNSEAPVSEPGATSPAPEGASEPVEADALIASKTQVAIKKMRKGYHRRLVTEMDMEELRQAFALNETISNDPNEDRAVRSKALGCLALVEEEMGKRAEKVGA